MGRKKKNKDSGRAILIGKGSGRLRKDVSNSVTTGHKNNNLSYTLIVKNPYAGYLNDGTDRMVQRQFVGTTPELRRKILLKIDQLTRRIWANL